MRPLLSRVPVSSKPQTIAIGYEGASRIVCGALLLSMTFLMLKIVGYL